MSRKPHPNRTIFDGVLYPKDYSMEFEHRPSLGLGTCAILRLTASLARQVVGISLNCLLLTREMSCH